jgi:hypothetical protein
MTSKLTAEEMGESLTGYDELAIEKAFQVSDVTVLAGTKQIRGLVFVALRREGQSDKDAFASVMEMPLKSCNEFFAEDEDEPMPDDPATESGKDDSPPE